MIARDEASALCLVVRTRQDVTLLSSWMEHRLRQEDVEVDAGDARERKV